MLATRDFHVSALSPDGAHIWILMGIFLWFLCICCLLPHHCFCFQELAENFVPSGRHVKLARVKVWSPGSSFQTYLVFSLRCQNVDKGFLFFFLFFLLTKLCRTYLCTEKPREDFIHCCAIQTLKRWIFFFNRSLHVRSPVWPVQLLTCICKSKHTFEVSLSRMQSCSLFAQTVLTAVKLMQNYKQKLQIKSPMVVLIFLTFWKGPYRENKTLISYFLSKRSLKIKSRMLS